MLPVWGWGDLCQAPGQPPCGAGCQGNRRVIGGVDFQPPPPPGRGGCRALSQSLGACESGVGNTGGGGGGRGA